MAKKKAAESDDVGSRLRPVLARKAKAKATRGQGDKGDRYAVFTGENRD